MLEANPFTPGKRLTRPERFSGRHKQLRAATRVVVQAVANNARHALITGERGVGKSSFSSQVQGIAQGEQAYLELLGSDIPAVRPKLLVVEHIAQTGQGTAEIALGLLEGLSTAKGPKHLASKLTFKFSIDLGLLKTEIGRKDGDTLDTVTKFINEVDKVLQAITPALDGILLVVDEVDRVASTPGVATFFKTVTERLAARGVENVAFLLIGLRGTLEALETDHKSITRVFRPIEVPLMDTVEQGEIIRKALDATTITATDEAVEFLSYYSGGYPNTVHVLGEAAWEIADEGPRKIDLAVAQAAVSVAIKGAVAEEYAPRYSGLIGRTRAIIDFVATHAEIEVPHAEILEHMKVSGPDISKNLDTLLRRDVLVRPKLAHYSLREPLFREYVKTVVSTDERPAQRRPTRRKDAN